MLRASAKIDIKKFSGDEAVGAEILMKALEGPMRQILENAGLEASVIINDVKSKKNNDGYDARADKYVCLLYTSPSPRD